MLVLQDGSRYLDIDTTEAYEPEVSESEWDVHSSAAATSLQAVHVNHNKNEERQERIFLQKEIINPNRVENCSRSKRVRRL